MGKLNIYVKWSYIIVASLMAIVSTVILARTLFYHGYLHKHEEIDKMLPSFIVMYVIFIITLLLPIIGVYGARKEKKWALIVFTVGMILCTLVMLNSERQQLTIRPEVAERVRANYLGFLPLSNASMNDIENLKYIQMELQCCGLDQGYQDWGYNISESCLCLQDSTNPCVEAPKNSSLSHRKHDQPIMIYKEPCLRYLIQLALAAINLVIGIEWGLILIWTLSVVLCIIILCQLRQKGDTPPVVYSAEAKSGNYSILTETADYT
ncbi:tetraspanin-8-like isoform X1 [Thunnus albacares]|uniref:tetraspanin-8-like isoform X1 n=2 Tax=Thunnus albacares TaxID=8236 RepID=UPI001CF617F8|nr:tetraspanin-8-like isoform X1 [Thunnus albacares]